MCTCVKEEGDDGEDAHSETSSLLSYTLRDVSFAALRYVSFAEVGIVCRVALREPMYLCTYVREEIGDATTAATERAPALVSAPNPSRGSVDRSWSDPKHGGDHGAQSTPPSPGHLTHWAPGEDTGFSPTPRLT